MGEFVYNRVFESAEEMTEWLKLVADAPKLKEEIEDWRRECQFKEDERVRAVEALREIADAAAGLGELNSAALALRALGEKEV